MGNRHRGLQDSSIVQLPGALAYTEYYNGSQEEWDKGQ